MKIKGIELKNFKRFTELKISDIPKSAKLVLMTGVNGSGKSCIFDVFEASSTTKDGEGFALKNKDYYGKNHEFPINVKINFHGNEFITLTNQTGVDIEIIERVNVFYGRSSLRQVPQLKRVIDKKIDFIKDSDRPRLYINRDERFENDIDKITKIFLREVYTSKGITVDELANKYISKINQGFKRIFGENETTNLALISIIPSLEGNPPEIKFQKGISEIHYDLLSSGEKEIFNIILNLYSRTEIYQDTIYFIDELDLHLNTNLQYALLKEIVENWIPENCQLWTASHSFGFIEYARDSKQATILDFDERNFDIPQVLFPSIKNNLDIFEIAIPKETIFKLFENKKIILCENLNDKFFNLLNISNTIFVGVKNSRDLFISIKKDEKYFGLRDRDFLTDNEKRKIENKYHNYKIFDFYCFENYLFHPDNLACLNLPKFDKQEYINEIVKQKNKKYDEILLNLKLSRNTYEELKDDKIKDKDLTSIISSLKSDKLSNFYSFFNMKDKFNKEYLQNLELNTEQLVKTVWFKNRIKTIITQL